MSSLIHFFAGQCRPFINNSQLPAKLITPTKSFLTSNDISVNQVSIIKKLDPNKAHEHVQISMRILKLRRYLINKILATIFKNCLNERMFPNEWKKGNIVAIHEKLISKL